jgi:HEAT repeat protein
MFNQTEREAKTVKRLTQLKGVRCILSALAISTLVVSCRSIDNSVASTEELIRRLTSRDANERKVAALALGEAKDLSAVKSLVLALKDKDSDVRAAVATALGRLGDVSAVSPLILALRDESWEVRQDVVRALGSVGDPHAIEPLLKIMKTEEEEEPVRDKAVEALGKIGLPAVMPLSSVLHNKNENLGARWRAAIALGKTRVPQAVETLIAAIDDDNPGVRQFAARALGDTGDHRAFEPLVRALKVNCELTRSGAAAGLGRLGDSRAIQPLIEALADKEASVRAEAIESLASLKAIQAAMPLGNILLNDENKNIRWGAAKSLMEIADEKAVGPLVTVLEKKHETSRIRMMAAAALAKISNPQAEKILLRFLKDKDKAVVVGALAFFIEMGIPGTEDLLIEAVNKYEHADVAKYFLNCGNITLEKAGRKLLKEYGLDIGKSEYRAGPRWGSRR